MSAHLKQYSILVQHSNYIPHLNLILRSLRLVGLAIEWAQMKGSLIADATIDIKCSVIHTLGIFNSYDNDLEQKLNLLDNIKTLMLWKFRGLTLAGRILVFKSLALSKLLCACTMKVPSKFVIDQLNTLHKNFIWNNK